MTAPDLRSAGRARTFALAGTATFAQVAFWYFATPGPTLLRDVSPGPNAAIESVVWTVVCFGVATLVIAGLLRLGPKDFGLRAPADARVLGVAVLLGLAVAPILYFASADPVLARTYPWVGVDWLRTAPIRWLAWVPIYAAYYVAFELFYRGVLFRVLLPRVGVGRANVAQAVLATLIHVGKPLPETLLAFPASLVFGALTVRSGSLLPAIVLHILIGVAMDVSVVVRGGPA